MKTAEELQKELDDEKAKAEANIKALQQKLTEADKDKKEILKQIEEIKKTPGDNDKIKELEGTIKTLSDSIGNLSKDKELERLAKKFPEVVPELLLGKSDEECELIVNKQKAKTEQDYVLRTSSHGPIYSDANEIDQAIESTKADTKLTTEEKFAKVRELKFAKEQL